MVNNINANVKTLTQFKISTSLESKNFPCNTLVTNSCALVRSGPFPAFNQKGNQDIPRIMCLFEVLTVRDS